MHQLTSRERVRRAVAHEPVDRMPIDLGGHTASGISAFAYRNLRRHLGLSTDDIRVHDMVQVTAKVDMDVLERFHCDCVLLEPPFRTTTRWNPRDDYRFTVAAAAAPERSDDGSWIVRKADASMRMPPGGFFFDGDWLSDWGEGSEDERIALYAREAERLHKETDLAVNFIGYSHGLGLSPYGGGSIDDALLAYSDPDELLRRREQALMDSIRRMGRIIDSFGRYIDLVSLSDDMGTQKGLTCGPAYIERFSIPYYRRFCAFVHEHSDVKVLLHSCGSVAAAIPLLIDAGIDVLNPVQISAKGMDPRELKQRFGARIAFWGGGCNTQAVLGRGTPSDVVQNVRELARIFRNGSGYVFNQVHNVMGDVAPENIVAMLETAYQESVG